jgi:multiple sugar transport system permease protein
MMIPGTVTMIPVYILLDKIPEVLNILLHTEVFKQEMFLPLTQIRIGAPIGLNSYFALIAPGFFSAYGTFLLRQFFMGLPVELEEAAKIDGCSLLGIFFRITVPLSKPAMATLGIFTFMGSWRAFLWPLIVINSEYMRTIPVGLKFFQGQFSTDMTLMMAGTMIALIPVIIAFLAGQRYFVEGIRLGAVKG